MNKKSSIGNHRSWFVRCTGAILSTVYLTTNSMAVPPSERVFWEQRRASAQQVRPPAIFSDRQNQDLQGTPADLGALISPYATIRDVRMSKNPAAPLVVHMQDLHGSLEAQENMARAMATLVNNQGMRLVGLEGAEGPFTLDDFRRYPEPVRQKVAQHFLKKDLIGAGESVALTSSRPITLWGLEDRPLYIRNVAAVKESLLNRDRVEPYLGPLDNALAEQKARVYSDDLRSFDQAFDEYEKGVLPLGGYIKALLHFQPETADSPTFANVRRLLSALNAEETLDFAAVERDRMKVLKILTERVSRPTMEAFMRASVEFRTGRQPPDTFETILKKLCADHNVQLSQFPHLNAYLGYTGLAGQIQREGLLNELKNLERTTQRRLAKTPAQKRVVEYSIDAQLLRKLLRNQMTPDDWADYGVRRTAIRTLPQQLVSAPRGPPAQDDEDLETFLKPFEAYCAIALDRNKAMATRLIDKMRQTQTKKAILVAGGFHTAGLTKYFRSQDISYVVLTPKVEHLDPHQNYLDVFARDPLPLEQVFAGAPLFLLSERGLADNSSHLIPPLLLAGLIGTLWQLTQSKGRPDKKTLQASLNRWVKMIGPRLQSLRPRMEKSMNEGILLSFDWKNKIRQFLEISSNGNVSVPKGNDKTPEENKVVVSIPSLTTISELGAAGLWGSNNLLRIVLFEQILLSLLALIGMVHFGIALPGQSVWDVMEGMIFVIGTPLFLTLLIIHFFTGVLQPDGSIKKLSLSEEEEDPIKKIMDHLGVSLRASGTASRSFLMLPFFALAIYLGMPFLIVVGFLLGAWAHDSSNQKKIRQWRSKLLMGGLTKIPMVQPTSVIFENAIQINSTQADSEESLVQKFQVIKLPPKNRLEFKVFLENISSILSQGKFNSFGLYSKHLTPKHGEEIEILLEKAQEGGCRLVMARWALAELMLAVGLNRGGLWLNRIQREAYAMEYHLKTNYFGYGDGSNLVMSDSWKRTEEGKNFARLIRATQMAAILRAAGSSIIDPLNTEGDPEKNQTRDIEILLAAWGILGNIHKTKIEEIYNLTLRTAFKIPFSTPPSKDEIEFLKIKLVHQLDSSFPTYFDPPSDNSFFKEALFPRRPGRVLEPLKALINRVQARGLPFTQKKSMEPITPLTGDSDSKSSIDNENALFPLIPIERQFPHQIKKIKALRTQA